MENKKYGMKPVRRRKTFAPIRIGGSAFEAVLVRGYFLIGIVWIAALFVLWQRITCPWQVNQGEAVNVEYARLILRGESPYSDLSEGPYLFCAYPPLFSLLQAALLGLFGGVWQAGRALAFAGYLGCGFLLGAWGCKHWNRPIAILLTFVFLLSPTWMTWGTMVRSDTFLLLLHFASFLLIWSIERDKLCDPMNRVLTAGVLAALACLIKPSAASLVLVTAIYYLFRRRWGLIILYLTTVTIPILLVTVYMQIATGGLYLKYTFTWLGFGYRPELLWGLLKDSFMPEAGWLLVACGLAIFRDLHPLLRLQLAASVLWLGALGRVTSAENYMLEFILYGFLALGETLPKLGRTGRLVFLGVLLTGFIFFSGRAVPTVPKPEVARMKASILPIYRQEGEHLALDPDLPVMAGGRLHVQAQEYTWMVMKGTWSPEPLIRDIAANRFSTVELYDIPRQYLLPPEVVAAVEKHYEVFLKAYGRRWYRPRHGDLKSTRQGWLR